MRISAGYIPWNEMNRLVDNLEWEGKVDFALLVAIGCYCGLRIGDLKEVSVSDFSDKYLYLVEQKTGKRRKIPVHKRIKGLLSKSEKKGKLFYNNGRPVSTWAINSRLKRAIHKYDIKHEGHISTHMFRKTLGRKVLEDNNYDERSLLYLMEAFNHTSRDLTKRYLGIMEEEVNHHVFGNL